MDAPEQRVLEIAARMICDTGRDGFEARRLLPSLIGEYFRNKPECQDAVNNFAADIASSFYGRYQDLEREARSRQESHAQTVQGAILRTAPSLAEEFGEFLAAIPAGMRITIDQSPPTTQLCCDSRADSLIRVEGEAL